MPALSPRELVGAILDALSASGCSGVLLTPLQAHPRNFAVSLPSGEYVSLWVYVWTLTHGGRASLPDEFRIQMTSVSSPLPENPKGLTVLMGYEPDIQIFSGFDIQRHKIFTAGSPSVQIDIKALRSARHAGLTFDRKSNEEIAIGIRPDQFINYAIHHHELHLHGTQSVDFGLLEKAGRGEEISDIDLAPLPTERKRLVQKVTRLSRQANFREQVMRAYENRCAVTGLQLRLVDAAHILPVGADGSSDDVRNGIALSPTYHRSFDNGLIYLDESYNMLLNEQKLNELQLANLAGGIEAFRSPLGRQILLPPDPLQWPNLQLIASANALRKVAG